MSPLITPQFYNTTCRLIRDVTKGLGRKLDDPNWVGGFCLPMIGSFGHECGGFKLMEEGSPTVLGSLGGISFAQWTGVKKTAPVGRREQFMRWCRAHHLHPYSYDAAVAFIIYELTVTAKGVVMATLNAPPVDPATIGMGQADRALLGRVIKFEKLYENAGVKHYPSRYRYAMAAREVYAAWAAEGFPEPGKYVMPKARFTAQFDKEFGSGESETTTRLAPPAPSDVGRLLDHPAPAATGRKRWPEALLSKDEIKAVQRALRDAGYVRVGEIDGRWGVSTTGAISALQAEAGLEVDGHYGPDTRRVLASGFKHTVNAVRASATGAELLKAGEPTLQAVHPVSVTSKLTTWGAAGLGTISGITSMWPDASSTIDMVKEYFTDVPGWVWFAAIALVAAYLTHSTKQVKQSVVAGYREGAVTTIANPIRRDAAAGELPDVPDEVEPEAPEELYHRDTDSVLHGPERPLGAE